MSLKRLDCSNNRLTFAQLEPVFEQNNFNNFRANFNYSPQANVGTATNTTVARGGSISLTITGYEPGKNDISSWTKKNQGKSAYFNPLLLIQNVSYSDSGQYICSITNSLVAGLTLQSEPITLKVTVPVNTPIVTKDDELLLYPNPSADQFRIKSPKFRDFASVLEIFDMAGKKCFGKQIPPGNEEINVDISRLNIGLYLCKIRFGDQCLTRKINVNQ